jgi:hypothetical protein
MDVSPASESRVRPLCSTHLTAVDGSCAKHNVSNKLTSSDGSTPGPHTPSSAPVTTSVHVFGPPPHLLPDLRNYLSQCGTIVSLVPGPEGSNWITVTYSAEWEAALLLRRSGDIVGGKWLLGVKLAGPGSLAGCSLTIANPQRNSSSAPTTQAAAPASFTSGVGTPVRLLGADNASIYKPRPNLASGAANAADAAEYDWDERPGATSGTRVGQAGFFGRVGELVVSDSIALAHCSLGDNSHVIYGQRRMSSVSVVACS